MSLTINADGITGEATRHTAAPLYDSHPEGSPWRVSWLPDRDYSLSRNEATTAMWIAETAAERELHSGNWPPQIDAWAGELGLSGPDAVARATEPV